ncbi:LysR family transcriptional regulator [Bacillus sp. AFS017336]|uniref:LysR family transcriptional regulator n=1 Tax=Bacillus sp. AFS017336 TaxID=2033489 RepID=UPI000BF19809|nr:LysR family transcriptional regulator [Bacillus sp. AFS017336]PEL08101.1 LysR family transcriptional regulator [Bacillus sp. AFS017336]
MDQILLVFMAVAEKRNFSRAAEELHMTQPSVSQQIQLLERQIGAKLFIRTNKYVQLTKAGEIVYLHAKEITSLYKRMTTLVNDLVNEASGHLKIGASYTFGEYVLPKILAEMKRSYPSIVPSVLIGNTREIVQSVLSYQVDVGIVEGDATNQNLTIQPFANDEMYIIAGTKSEISCKEILTMDEIENETWIVREEGSGTREATERLFEVLKIRPKNIVEFGSTQLIKEAVEAGMGITYLSELTIKKEKQLGTIDYLKVEGTPIQRNFSIITDKIELQTKSMELFIELIKK